MKVILYTPDFNIAPNVSHATTMALSEGLTKLGVEHDVRKTKHWRLQGEEIADVAIVNGWWKQYIDGRNKVNRNVVIKAQEAAGKPAWCIERGFLLNREEWSGFSIGGFCSNGGDFRAEGMPPDRWEKLGIQLQPWRTGGDHILICAQVPWDTQVQDGDHLPWLEKTIRDVRKYTDRPIVFRGHPKAWRQPNPYGELSAQALSMVRHEPLDLEPSTKDVEDMANAHAIVTYNSNMATLANVAGLPVFTGADCLADPIANRDWSLLDSPPHPDREQWISDLCYKQWHIEEFREAKPWLHLTRPYSTEQRAAKLLDALKNSGGTMPLADALGWEAPAYIREE